MKKKLLKSAALLLATLIIITQTSCMEKSEPVSKNSYYLDTICEITIYDMDKMSDDAAKKVIDKGFSLCNEYEKLLSKTKDGSDIYKINHAKGKPVKCDNRTIDVIKKGIDYGDLSDGRFDITIGKVTDLWDFHAETPKVPDKVVISEALKAVNYKQIKITGNTVTMSDPNGEIDLGGIAKGYIGDRVAELLKSEGVTSAIINLGGNIVAIGGKGDDDFNIGIEKPYSDRSEIIGSVKVKDATVVTSGIYERYFEVNGKKYHHILDVNTGYPVDSDIEGVTVVGKLGMSVDCDGLSTTCLILGVKKATKLIESIDGIEALFIAKDGTITQTSGMNVELSN